MTSVRSIIALLGIFFLAGSLQAQPEAFAKELSELKGLAKVEAIRDHVYKLQNDTSAYLIPLADEGLRLCEKDGYAKVAPTMLRLLGSLCRGRGKTDTALVLLNRALELAMAQKLDSERYEILGVRGTVYSNIQEYEKGIADYIATLNYLEESGKFFSLGHRLGSIGNAYLYLGMVENGIKYNRKALMMDTVMQIPWMLSRIYNSLGYACDELGKYDSALFYYDKTFMIAQSQKDSVRMGMAKVNICSALEANGEYEEAEDCLISTNYFLKQAELEEYCVHTYSTLVNIQLKAGQGKKALESIGSLQFYLNQYPDDLVKTNVPEMLSMAYEATGQVDSALKYKKIHAELQDSLAKASKLEQIEELRLTYETEKKDEEIRTTKRENELKDERNKQIQTLWLISVIALLLFSAFIYLSINRRLLKKKNELAQQKAEEKQALLKASINGQEEERKRIARELHDGIGQQFTAIKLAYESSDLKAANEPGKMSQLIEQAADDVRNLSHQMMPRVLQEVGLKSALSDLVDSVNSKEGLKVTFESRNIDERFHESIEINFYRIAQELINNALKHADASEISTMLYRADNQLILMVDDNGKGVDLEKVKGHGLTSMRSRVEAIGAELDMESSKGNGFMAQVKLNLSNFQAS